MADTNDGNTMVQLVTALHDLIIQEEEERWRNPEAWLATLTATTQQQWAFVQCMRLERARREAQAHPAPRTPLVSGIEREDVCTHSHV